MSEKKVKNPILIIDIVITVILAIVMGVGIGLSVSNRRVIHSGSDELTVQNYTDYVKVGCRLGDRTDSDKYARYDYRLTVSAKYGCTISDLEITLEVISENSDFVTYTLKAGEVTEDRPCEKTGQVSYACDGSEIFPTEPEVTVNVLTVSGKCSFYYVTRG